MIDWRCWYDDGIEYNSADHKFIDLPLDGFQIRIVYSDPPYKEIQMGMDFYFEAEHSSGEIIYGTGNNEDEIKSRYTNPVIKTGRWAPNEFYNKLIIIAMASVSP